MGEVVLMAEALVQPQLKSGAGRLLLELQPGVDWPPYTAVDRIKEWRDIRHNSHSIPHPMAEDAALFCISRFLRLGDEEVVNVPFKRDLIKPSSARGNWNRYL